jgi:ribosomal protein S25
MMNTNNEIMPKVRRSVTLSEETMAWINEQIRRDRAVSSKELEYIRGLDDALEMAAQILSEAKDLDVARSNLEKLQLPVKERKITELRRHLFILDVLEKESVEGADIGEP